MFKKFINLVVGDLDDKRKYKEMLKRVNKLPENYSLAFKEIQNYIYTVGISSEGVDSINNILEDLLELFETSVADGINLKDIIGSDPGKFTNELIIAHTSNYETLGDQLNKEIMERFKKEEK
ncbi:MAG: DUF1048 domain-containing protein [Clostridium sp.]